MGVEDPAAVISLLQPTGATQLARTAGHGRGDLLRAAALPAGSRLRATRFR
jgi:hypothetical protein